MNPTVLGAIFRRDFVSYFSNPTGYVFICVFVMLSSLAAFWPPAFFGNNLANLDQLSGWMPFILLVFIPAISMSIWAEERRQGTDELLLTLPATDFDVVLGKFLAGVAIYTVALLFSMFSIFLVFSWGLGSPDAGLFVGSYLGYWFVGIAMLSIGMVASFLTSNLTVGFILGMVFNAPLALFGVADLIFKNPATAQVVRQWSALEQFTDFERGVVSVSSVVYFLSIAAVMLYVSMVLISKRHWAGGDEGETKGAHYFVRALCLLAIIGAANVFLTNHDARADMTTEGLNSLSESTMELVEDIGDDEDVPPIRVDAYVSPNVPAEYAAQKRNLLSTLDELSATSGGKIRVTKHEIENFSEQATLAERAYGIEPRTVITSIRGARKQEEIFLGAAFSCGLDKVVLPFIDRGIPVEYEVVRSITTVAQRKRQRLGLLKTAVELNGGFSMQGATEPTQLITELKKQYDVVDVDPANPITDTYDVLLAVQPSSLGPAEMDNFVDAVRSGQPTAIFEDPFPIPNFWPSVVGTSQPNPPQGGGMMGMFGGGQPGAPKGDISQLWNLIGVRMTGDEIIWQDYNPYPRAADLVESTWVFVDEANGAMEPFAALDPVTAGLRQILMLFPGSVRGDTSSDIEFTPLTVTGSNTGTLTHSDIQMAARAGFGLRQRRTGEQYVLAARLQGEASLQTELSLETLTDDSAEDEADNADDTAPEPTPINAIVVADIDCLADPFFAIREMGASDDLLVQWNFQNVAFVLNVLDSLADDGRFLEVRKRTRQHRILSKIEEATEDFRNEASKEADKFKKDTVEEIEAVRREFEEEIAKIEARTDLQTVAKQQLIDITRARLSRERDVKIESLEQARDRQIRQSERDLDGRVRGVQDFYKTAAVLLPPIPPILLAFFVFFHRREAEREGVAKSRLRYGKAPDTDEETL
ncbi:MAG: Gldg family protein [Planctomycetota bacterium]